MDKRRKKALTEARYKLTTNLNGTSEICDYLISCGELTDIQQEDIMSKSDRSKKNSELCKYISVRGDSAYDHFREALVETNAPQFLLDLLPNFKDLDSANGTVCGTPASVDSRAISPDALGQSRGAVVNPTANILTEDFLKKLERIEISDSADSKKAAGSNAAVIKSDDLQSYQIDTTRKTGLALVINNVNFLYMKERNGSDVDDHNIKLLLKAYNFEIFEEHTSRDLRETEMKDKIERFAFLKDHQKYSCSVVIILTHGQDGYLYATDSHRRNLVSVKWILEQFEGKNCPNLNGKPKLFFFQACRGELMDKGTDKYGYDDSDSHAIAQGGDVPQTSEAVEKQRESEIIAKMLNTNYEDETDAIRSGETVASHADMFIAYATVPGFVSWRNSANGSWFIQAIVHVFPKYSASQDLLSMMTEVNRLVQATWASSSGNFKMTPSQTHQLTKKFFFPTFMNNAQK